MQKTCAWDWKENRLMWKVFRNLFVLLLMAHVGMLLASAGWAQSSSSTVSLDPAVVGEKPTVPPLGLTQSSSSTVSLDPAVVEEEPTAPPPALPPVPTGPVPFAKQEQALRNSERWKQMTPEEQEKALDKIYKYRKLFQQRQVELMNQYSPYLIDKPKKKKSVAARRRSIAEQQFEDIWGKWQALTPKTQVKLAKQWKIKESLPSQRRRDFLKFWNSLVPGDKQRFRFDLQYQ